MPVFEQGYRRYSGSRARRIARWWPIARTSFRVTMRWPFYAVLVLASFPLFQKIFEVYAAGAGAALFPGARIMFGFSDGLFYDLISRETFFTVLLLTVTGAGQIAEDLRSGALQIYFGKPIRQADYVIGKLAAAVFSALLVTLAPAIVLFAACAAFAPDFSFITGNPLLPLRILGYCGLVSLSLGSLVLALSSLARSGRSVALLFAGAYFLTMLLSRVLDRLFMDWRFAAVHIGKCLDAAGRSLFVDGPNPPAPTDLSLGMIASIFFLSVLLLSRRVSNAEVVS
ncbi:MAG: ABC transporter permease [Planctomycetes bacterium]|jgi:ABC-type transport system involved in multi-copper enzyme maturation permease subunit|nr:ABC transporter permease [Planctomycetota bacterium]